MENISLTDSELIKKKRQEYYLKNKEVILQRVKEYNKNNNEKVTQYKKKYREENKIIVKSTNKKYYTKNRDNIILTQRKYKVNRFKYDTIFKLSYRISTLMRNSFKNNNFRKTSNTQDILGCSFDEFKLYLESKFEDWMNWENKGLYNGQPKFGWDVDHIIPTSSATTEEELIILNHYTNLQPLCSYINRDIKRNNF